jgi:hypothetical protein
LLRVKLTITNDTDDITALKAIMKFNKVILVSSLV